MNDCDSWVLRQDNLALSTKKGGSTEFKKNLKLDKTHNKSWTHVIFLG